MTATEDRDVVELLLDQHNQVRDLFGRLRTAQGQEKRELFEDLVRLLAVHETAEELVVHPTARRKIDGGDQVVESRLREEDVAKHKLADLYELGVDHPNFDAELAAFADAVARHAEHEEAEEFSRLRQKLSPDELRGLAGAVKAAEAAAPTRPHPEVGESAVANLLAGPPMAVFDRVRDAVSHWRQKSS
jgi:hemerythrin-like domain-containing protein